MKTIFKLITILLNRSTDDDDDDVRGWSYVLH